MCAGKNPAKLIHVQAVVIENNVPQDVYLKSKKPCEMEKHNATNGYDFNVSLYI